MKNDKWFSEVKGDNLCHFQILFAQFRIFKNYWIFFQHQDFSKKKKKLLSISIKFCKLKKAKILLVLLRSRFWAFLSWRNKFYLIIFRDASIETFHFHFLNSIFPKIKKKEKRFEINYSEQKLFFKRAEWNTSWIMMRRIF